MGNDPIQDYVKEYKFGESPDSLSSEQLEKVLEQMKISICKIKKEKDKIFGTGFFCKIPFPDQFTLLPVLITCNHVLDISDISKGTKINFSLNNEKIKLSILIDNQRKVYTNEKIDATVIEINPQKDNISSESFLDIDENINKNCPNDTYKDKTVYILHYENGKNMKYSVGTIISIAEDTYNINHNCATEHGSSGGPIINSFNSKVMGIHKGYKNKKNLGTFLRLVINEFNEKYNNKNINNTIEKDENETNVQIKENNSIINVPKKKSRLFNDNKFNNIIYYDDNKNDLNSLYLRCDFFEKNTNGAFILCSNEKSLELIKEEIFRTNDCVFSLIIGQNNTDEIMQFLSKNLTFQKNIIKICVYGKNNSIKEKYNNITDVYDNPQEVVDNFIIKYSMKEIKPYYPYLMKLLSYEDYLDEYKNIHFQISKYYGDLSPKSFETNFELLKKLIQIESVKEDLFKYRKEDLIEGFSVFKIIDDLEKLDKLIIREYTRDIIYLVLRKWAIKIKNNNYSPVIYFISRFMYSLNSYANKNKKYLNKNTVCYRGSRLPYSSILNYERKKGKIIFNTDFMSTVIDEIAAKIFSFRGKRDSLWDKRFSTIFYINNIYQYNFISNAIDISEPSIYPGEREYLFLPFSFFRVKDVKINTNDYIADIYLETVGKKQILENEIKLGKEIEYNSQENIIQIKK